MQTKFAAIRRAAAHGLRHPREIGIVAIAATA
jgi:hypothetical protein